MRKLLALLLCAAMVMTVFTACTKSKETGAGGKAKTGLAVITTAAKSKDATADADGLVEADSTAVAVLVNDKGVIVNCIIDVIQPKINFSAAGELTTDMATEFVSKKELGDAYGMKKASGIGKEWYEQAKALEAYVIGKTLDQVKGIALNEEGAPAVADLTSSVTVTIDDIVKAVEKAVNGAQDLGASTGDKLGLGLISGLGHSVSVSDKDGLAQAYTHYGVITLNKDGKITSSIIDASQANINFSKEGKITSDLTAEIKTKCELGDAYGMRKASGIGKEWFEQAKAFSDYIVGKTVADVKAIAVNEEGSPTAADLTSSVTVGVGDLLTVIEKAGATAK